MLPEEQRRDRHVFEGRAGLVVVVVVEGEELSSAWVRMKARCSSIFFLILLLMNRFIGLCVAVDSS